MTMQERQNIAKAIGIQRKIGSNGVFFKDSSSFNLKKLIQCDVFYLNLLKIILKRIHSKQKEAPSLKRLEKRVVSTVGCL